MILRNCLASQLAREPPPLRKIELTFLAKQSLFSSTYITPIKGPTLSWTKLKIKLQSIKSSNFFLRSVWPPCKQKWIGPNRISIPLCDIDFRFSFSKLFSLCNFLPSLHKLKDQQKILHHYCTSKDYFPHFSFTNYSP